MNGSSESHEVQILAGSDPSQWVQTKISPYSTWSTAGILGPGLVLLIPVLQGAGR